MTSLFEPKTTIIEQDARQRINRVLKPYLHSLKIIRGDYYVLDQCRNVVSSQKIDLETFGQKLGVIKSWETVDISEIDKWGYAARLPISKTATPRRTDRYIGNMHNYFCRSGMTLIDPHVIERLRRLLARKHDYFSSSK